MCYSTFPLQGITSYLFDLKVHCTSNNLCLIIMCLISLEMKSLIIFSNHTNYFCVECFWENTGEISPPGHLAWDTNPFVREACVWHDTWGPIHTGLFYQIKYDPLVLVNPKSSSKESFCYILVYLPHEVCNCWWSFNS